MKLIVPIIAGVTVALACAPDRSMAQQQSFTDFVAPFHAGGYPQQPEDTRIAVDAVGSLQAFRGRPWWQALAFCIGTHSWQSEQLERAGNTAEADALRAYLIQQFEDPAIRRLVSDRGISEDEAVEILRPDVAFQKLEFAFAGPEERPFAADQARCRSVAANHARLR